MNIAMCRLFARPGGLRDWLYCGRIPTVETVGFDMPSLPGRVFYPNTLCLSIVTPDLRNSVMNSCSNVHFL